MRYTYDTHDRLQPSSNRSIGSLPSRGIVPTSRSTQTSKSSARVLKFDQTLGPQRFVDPLEARHEFIDGDGSTCSHQEYSWTLATQDQKSYKLTSLHWVFIALFCTSFFVRGPVQQHSKTFNGIDSTSLCKLPLNPFLSCQSGLCHDRASRRDRSSLAPATKALPWAAMVGVGNGARVMYVMYKYVQYKPPMNIPQWSIFTNSAPMPSPLGIHLLFICRNQHIVGVQLENMISGTCTVSIGK